MSKTKEELEQLKSECETLNNKLCELSEDELGYVKGGNFGGFMSIFASCIECNLNPDTCIVKKNGGLCPKEGI